MDDSYWWSWYGMWSWMGPITKATVVLMVLLLLCAIYNFLEQVEKQQGGRIAANSALEILHRGAPLKEVVASIETLDDRQSSSVVLAGLEAFKTAPSGVSDVLAVRLAERAMERQEALAHLEARRSLILLDTVANLAPMLGMFATTRAILHTFGGIAMARQAFFAYITKSISHAVVPAAIGLAVAAPTALFYSSVSRRIENLDARNLAMMQEVLSYLRDQPRVSSEDTLPIDTRTRKALHCGNRLMLSGVWLWWLYFAGLLVAGAFAQ